MAFGATPSDSNNYPINSVYVPGVGFKALQGGAAYTDSLGNDSSNMRVELASPSKATYVGMIKDAGIVATTPGDVFTLTGSATKVIRLVRFAAVVEVSATPTTVNLTVTKHSTADTGGTIGGTTSLVSMDSSNPSATGTITAYTANPTVGTVVAVLYNSRFTAELYANEFGITVMDFGQVPAKQPVLRGTSQQFAASLNGTSLTGPVGTFMFVWTEE